MNEVGNFLLGLAAVIAASAKLVEAVKSKPKKRK